MKFPTSKGFKERKKKDYREILKEKVPLTSSVPHSYYVEDKNSAGPKRSFGLSSSTDNKKSFGLFKTQS